MNCQFIIQSRRLPLTPNKITVANSKTPARPCKTAAIRTCLDDLNPSRLRRTSRAAMTAKNAVINESVDNV